MADCSVSKAHWARTVVLIVLLVCGSIGAADVGAQCVSPGVSIDSPANPNIDPFADQAVDTTSAVQPVTIRLTPGTGALCITSITTTGDFAQTNNCGSLLPDGATCTIDVTFTPTVLGLRSGSLVVTGVFAGGTSTIPLSGSGIAGVGAPAPSLEAVPALGAPLLVLLAVLVGAFGALRRRA
ncbi:MAG TPA: hypothetical protein VGI14_04035 [Casimicrobiaceae bacterium]|jgi:hypothetical protein